MKNSLHPLRVIGVLIAAAASVAGAHAQAVTPVPADDQFRSKVRVIPDAALLSGGDADSLLEDPDANPYGAALLLRRLGFADAARGLPEEAIARFERALALESLSPPAVQALRYNLGRLYTAVSRYADATAILERWRQDETAPDASGLALLANAYVRTGRHADAENPLRAAIAATPDAQEHWQRMLAQILHALGRHEESARVLEDSLRASPESPELWITLGNLYLAAGRYDLALIYLHLAHVQGFLSDGDGLVRLAQLFVVNGMPLDGATLIDAALSAGTVRHDSERFELLADAWLQAGEPRRAAAALSEAAARGQRGELHVRLGELLVSLEDWPAAITALSEALTLGELGTETGRAQLLMGEARLRAGDVRRARRAFEVAAEMGGSYREAQAWIDYMDSLALAASEPAATPVSTDVEPPAQLPANQVAAMREELEVIEAPRRRFIYIGEQTTVDELAQTAGHLVRQVVREVRRERLEWNGPLHLITHAEDDIANPKLTLEAAAPVRGGPPPRGRFRARNAGPFRCVTVSYEGPAEGVRAAWNELYAKVTASGYELTGESRQLVVYWSRDENEDSIFELQVGIR